ncbi:hypothetical protein [Streptomyces canus]|uniref:hypothetical protein n=1 Tax=Streptomyces canus TaxID=58343 RepID=UPI0030E1D10F
MSGEFGTGRGLDRRAARELRAIDGERDGPAPANPGTIRRARAGMVTAGRER